MYEIEKHFSITVDETLILEYLLDALKIESTALEDLELAIVSISSSGIDCEPIWWVRDDVTIPVELLDVCLSFGKQLFQILKDMNVYQDGLLICRYIGTLHAQLAVLLQSEPITIYERSTF